MYLISVRNRKKDFWKSSNGYSSLKWMKLWWLTALNYTYIMLVLCCWLLKYLCKLSQNKSCSFEHRRTFPWCLCHLPLLGWTLRFLWSPLMLFRIWCSAPVTSFTADKFLFRWEVHFKHVILCTAQNFFCLWNKKLAWIIKFDLEDKTRSL